MSTSQITDEIDGDGEKIQNRDPENETQLERSNSQTSIESTASDNIKKRKRKEDDKQTQKKKITIKMVYEMLGEISDRLDKQTKSIDKIDQIANDIKSINGELTFLKSENVARKDENKKI